MMALSDAKYLAYQRTVQEYFGTPQTGGYPGEVGIEIEVEGNNLPPRVGSYWAVHQDGSLRNGGLEYVLSKPTERKNVLKFLQYLEKKFEETKAEIVQSPRTSVHVHLNAKDQTILEVYNNLVLYLIFEDALTHYAGPTRVGNLFCLRAKDTDYFIQKLIEAAEKDNYTGFMDETHLRYTAVNVCALSKFNSLEYRALRGTTDPDVIHEWVQILCKIKDAAKEYQVPTDIIKDFSASGPVAFSRKILGDFAEKLPVGLDVSLREGMRLAQDVAYARSWEYTAARPIQRTFGGSKVRAGGMVVERPPFGGDVQRPLDVEDREERGGGRVQLNVRRWVDEQRQRDRQRAMAALERANVREPIQQFVVNVDPGQFEAALDAEIARRN